MDEQRLRLDGRLCCFVSSIIRLKICCKAFLRRVSPHEASYCRPSSDAASWRGYKQQPLPAGRPAGCTGTLTALRWQLQFIGRNHLFSLAATVPPLFVTQGFAALGFSCPSWRTPPGAVTSSVLLSLAPAASEPRCAAHACLRVEAALENGPSVARLHILFTPCSCGQRGSGARGEITQAV